MAVIEVVKSLGLFDIFRKFPVALILSVRWLSAIDGVVSDWRDRVRALSSSLEEGLLDLDDLCDGVQEASAAMNYGACACACAGECTVKVKI